MAAAEKAHDPWKDERTTLVIEADTLVLPRFTRSIVLRLRRSETL